VSVPLPPNLADQLQLRCFTRALKSLVIPALVLYDLLLEKGHKGLGKASRLLLRPIELKAMYPHEKGNSSTPDDSVYSGIQMAESEIEMEQRVSIGRENDGSRGPPNGTPLPSFLIDCIFFPASRI